MRYKRVIFLLATLFITIGSAATARNASSKNPSPKRNKSQKEMKVSTEFGLGVGAQYNWLECEPGYEGIDLKYGFSGGASLQFRLNIGKYFAIQPEVKYSYGKVKVSYSQQDFNFTTKAKFSLVQVPLLFSFNLSALRFNFGPVFSLMDNPEYMFQNADGSYEKCYLGKIYPTVTYTAGVSVKFAKCFIVDIRYTGQFREKRDTNELIYHAEQSSIPFKTRIHGVQIHLGYAF